ncbi:Na+/H+ antiporter subunit E [Ornithinimicrobium sp. Y1694]|uniref:Na+/H+ antiporter subunit E n=1 Tax=Ornithinimicrobium sp. Y1694 TaxID=3418590 RepID=UPI003CF2A79D
MRLISRRWNISIGAVLWLALVWMILWSSFTLLTFIGGLLVGFFVLAAFPLPHVQVRLRPRPIAIVVLVSRFLWDLVRASVEVAWLAVRPGRTARGRVMDMELVGDDALLQTLTAELVALVPGSVVIDLDPSSRVLTIHALDVRTRQEAEKVRHRVRAQEARVLRAFHPDAEALLDPRRRREAQERAAREGLVSTMTTDEVKQLGAHQGPRPDEGVR